MKLIKKIFTMLFAIMLVLGMTIMPSYANGEKGSITISKDAQITTKLTGMEVTAYKVLNQVNPTETDQNKKQYEVTGDFTDFFNIAGIKNSFNADPGSNNKVYLGFNNNSLVVSTTTQTGYIEISAVKLDLTYPEADLVSRITGDTGASNSDLSKFYTWLEKYIENNKDTFTQTPVTVSAGESEVSFTGLDHGYYALIFSGVPSGISVKQGIIVPTSTTINLKAEPLTVTKTVSKNPDKDFAEKISAAMSDTLYYHINSTVPKLEDYSNLTEFKFTDTFTHQKVNGTSFKIVIDNNQFTLDGTAFKLNGTGQTIATLNLDTAHNTFTVDFTTSALEKYQGKKVELQYSAQLTADAIDVNTNDVILTYTNNGSTGTLIDNTKVYTYGLKIQKTFSDHSKNHYNDVKFKLYSDQDCTTEINLAKTSDGVYTTLAAGTTVTTDDGLGLASDGTLTIKGLDAGTYYLKETATAEDAGFTLADVVTVNLVATSNLTSLDDTSSAYLGSTKLDVDIEHSSNSIALATFEVLNQKGFNLPTTGGAGTWMMTIGGIVLIAAAGSLYVISKKKKHNLD